MSNSINLLIEHYESKLSEPAANIEIINKVITDLKALKEKCTTLNS